MATNRLGCLYIPEFRIRIHRRDRGLEPSAPLVLLAPLARRSVVAAASSEAEAAGVRVGMSLAQAEISCPDALFREQEPELYVAAGQDLLERLLTQIPVVEALRLGLYYLGTKGLRWLYRDESAMMQAVLEQVKQSGMLGSTSAAGTRFCAMIAARLAEPGEFRQVLCGDERKFLAPLPITVLPASDNLLERLNLLGIATLGELAALSPRSVERRYGAEGVRMYRLARAEDDAHINASRPTVPRQRSALLEHPVINAEGLLFIVAPLVESLIQELSHEGRAIAGMCLSLRLEREEELELPLLLGSPVTRSKPLIDLLRLKLERVQLNAGVIEARLEASHITEPSTPQGDLFRRVGSPSGMAVTLARLSDTLGPEAVLTSVLADGFRFDETFSTQPVREGAPGLMAAAAGERGNRKKRTRGTNKRPPARSPTISSRASAPRSTPCPVRAAALQPSPPPARFDQTLSPTAETVGPSHVAKTAKDTAKLSPCFRWLKQVRLIQMQVNEDGPISLIAQGRRRQINHRQGPFRMEGSWWVDAYAKDYYRLTLADRAEVLVSHCLASDVWQLEGVYD